MNTETYEQVAPMVRRWATRRLSSSRDHDQVEFFDAHPIGIEIPAVVELTVVETEPELKGATVSNVNKPAKLETGITIQVPPFVKQGDRIRVDTNEGRYIERAK
jgi:elongation factor P